MTWGVYEYYFGSQQREQTHSEYICKHTHGGHLTSVENREEYEFLSRFLPR